MTVDGSASCEIDATMARYREFLSGARRSIGERGSPLLKNRVEGSTGWGGAIDVLLGATDKLGTSPVLERLEGGGLMGSDAFVDSLVLCGDALACVPIVSFLEVDVDWGVSSRARLSAADPVERRGEFDFIL